MKIPRMGEGMSNLQLPRSSVWVNSRSCPLHDLLQGPQIGGLCVRGCGRSVRWVWAVCYWQSRIRKGFGMELKENRASFLTPWHTGSRTLASYLSLTYFFILYWE